MRQLFAEFHLPKPGYVLASALVLGMVLGFSTSPDNSANQDAGYTTTQSYDRRRRGVVMSREDENDVCRVRLF